MGKITLAFTNDKSITVEARIKGTDILSQLPGEKKDIVAIKVDNEIVSLNRPIKVSCKVEPVYLKSNEGASVYRRTLSFVLAAAANRLFPGVRLLIGHSLGYGYYYTLDREKPITVEEIAALQEEMQKIAKKDSLIYTQHISYQEATEIFEKLNLIETRKQLDYVCKRSVLVNRLDIDKKDFCEIYYEPLAPSTGILKVIELKQYGEGFLLRFPTSKEPDVIPPFTDNPKIFEIYQNYKRWGKLVGVTSIASLNALTARKKVNDFIDICETYQNQHYARVAHMIHERGNVKVVLIAGPSSSGKTTSAYKVSLQLRALGYNPRSSVLTIIMSDMTRPQGMKTESSILNALKL